MDPQRPPRKSSGTSPRSKSGTPTTRPRVSAPTAAPNRRPAAAPNRRPATGRSRRPSRRTFLVRRLVVLGVVVLLVFGIVAIARALFSSDTSKAAGETDPTAQVVDASTTSVVGGDPGTTSADGAVTDPTATTLIGTGAPASVDPNRTPTAADPARVLLVGDSEAGGLSPFLQKVLDLTGVTSLSTDYKVSSGLVRSDFFDWPAHLQATVPAANPDIVIALFGGNDGQAFLNTNNKVDSAEWRAEYGKRVGAVMDFLSSGGRTLIWVGVPNGKDPSLTANLAVQNEVVKDQITKHPNVIFVDSWSHFTGIDGNFAPYVIDPRDGQYKPVRSDTDGFHLNTVGEEILAVYVGQAVHDQLVVRGAAI